MKVEDESPLARPAPQISETDRQSDVVPRRALPVRILLVDDEPANLLALEAVLGSLGHDMVRAQSGEDALAKTLEHDFAVVLMDIRMPGMDGYETAARMRQRAGTLTPIIFLTAEDFDEDRVLQGYSRGAVDVLVKPFHPDMLVSKVSVLVDLYLSRETIRAQAVALRQAELEAIERQNETRLQTIIDLMPLGVIALHADGKPYFCNRAWRENIGIDLDASSGASLLEVIHPEDRSRARDTLKEAISTGRSVEIECRLRSLRGDFRWHVVRALPDLKSHGAVVGWIATATDVERQKLAEQQATEANRMKDEFLAVVSHELRTPLMAILGWTSMLQSRIPDTAQLQRGLETIRRNAKAQALLIDDILDVVRIISGKLRLEVGRLDVSAVVAAALESMRPAAEAKGIDLEAALESVPMTMGDPDRLQQVVSNLITNSIKFTTRGGKVRIWVGTVGGRIEIRVDDDGCGIDPAFLPHVFDRFRQADASTTRRQGGVGLGLAIVDHIVRLHEGSVAANSPGIGRGSTFVVTLPVREAPALEDAKRTAPTPWAGTASILGGRKILLVDDEVDSRDYVTQVLASAGADVTSVASSKDALDVLAHVRPDILLSDIGLPGEDGYAFIRQVRVRSRDEGGMVPALALTGYARPEDAARAREAGFDMHVPKPIEASALVGAVARLAHARR
jgi:PAS domain S-box-containing protein